MLYMLAGDDAPEDILRSVKRGLYAVNFGGGAGGYHQRKVRFLSIGSVSDRGRQVHSTGEGCDADRQRAGRRRSTSRWWATTWKLDEGIGNLRGKDGQSVPVGVGMPTIKLDKMTVGGTGR